jgi:hypothetical protein
VTLGPQLAHWVEHLLVHGPGDVQGDPLELDDERFRALARMYELDPTTGRRMVRRYVLSRAKGWAKSEFAGAIVCLEALGPVRFDRWAAGGEVSWWGYTYSPGEPIGKPVTYPFIRCLATEEGQSGNTYDNVRFMLTEGRIGSEIAGLDVGLTRTFLPQGGEIRPSTASSSAKDGGKETFAVADESHLYVLPELRRMHETVRRNMAKRKAAEPWMLDTTTAWAIGEGSIAEQSAQPRDDAGFVLDHQAGEVPEVWGDDAAMLEQLARAYRGADFVDLERVLAEIRDPQSHPLDSQRYFLNVPASWDSVSAWLPKGSMEACREPLVDLEHLAERGEGLAVVAVDSATRHDSVAVVTVRRRDDGRIGACAWALVGDGESLYDAELVEQTIRSNVASLAGAVEEVVYDPAYFVRSAQALADEGLPMVEFPQSPQRMVPASARAYEAIVGADLVHDFGPEETRQVVGAVPRAAGEGWRLSKGKSPGRIDTSVALAMAVARLIDLEGLPMAVAPAAAVPDAPDGSWFRPRGRLDL